MKTETKKAVQDKEFDTVQTFRAIKEQVSGDIVEMRLEQIKAYLQARKVRPQR